MRRFLTLFLLFVCTFAFVMSEAEAKRFGGGRGFGMQRSASSFSRSFAPQAPIAPIAQRARNSWVGPLAGLAVGGILASLLMGHGIGSGILSWLLIGGVIFMLISFVRSRKQMFATQANQFQHRYANASHFTGGAATSTPPINFDEINFLREAKAQFIRLQAAYDQKNLQDIRQFTAPVVFAEIQLQLQERGDAENITEVVTLDAELLDAVVEDNSQIASIRFSGLVREDNQPVTTILNEIWHFQKLSSTTPWLVTGIQQV